MLTTSGQLSPVNSTTLPSIALISIILPVHNQADHIEQVVKSYHSQMIELPINFEFVLVPNACTDDSENICLNLAKNLTNVRTVHCPKPGWGSAINTGIANAKGDLLCYASSARISAADLTQHVQFALEHPTSVVKARRLSQDSPIRSVGSWVYNWLCRTLLRIETKDVNGTPKTFPKSFGSLLELSEDGYLVDLEFSLVCKKNRYPILELPIKHTPRHGGRSTTSIKTALTLYTQLFAYWLKCRSDRSLSRNTNIKSTSDQTMLIINN